MELIPSSCDCVWTVTEHPDGSRSGSIFIASERCQRALMHPRIFTTSGPRTEPSTADRGADG